MYNTNTNTISFDNNSGNFFYKEVADDFTFFKKVVSVFSASFLDESYHLTDRELKLLYNIYMFKTKGSGNIYSKANISTFFPTFGSKRILQIWLPKLQNKEWIRYTKTSVDFLEPKLIEFLKSDKISFSVHYKRQDSGGF